MHFLDVTDRKEFEYEEESEKSKTEIQIRIDTDRKSTIFTEHDCGKFLLSVLGMTCCAHEKNSFLQDSFFLFEKQRQE